ncbi:hypothetical protein PSHT_00454 [Puccinia striiformis]|uniref:Phenylalanyl-tRNA synthetase domain-containing protein n=1 Tax=Puccinia striiformis TaxID=27350 RepID=A0A2S4WN15_9BASI|nr:hypothetical protein PSHT_00454 [Puccinia striiformis]
MTTTNFDNHDIQQHILTILNSAAPIADTQLLSYPGRQASDPEECAFTEYQLSIKSALDNGLLMAKLQAKPGPDSAKIGQGKAFRNKRIKKRSDGGFIQAVCVPFRLLSDIIILSIHLFFQVTADQLITQTKLFIFLTLMEVKLIVGRWKTATFKPYNLNTEGVPPNGGALHPLINVRDPLIKVREEFSNIFFGMGFIPGTGDGKYIKTSLWYFDSLFVPQQHPVQGSQDMSYLQGAYQKRIYMLSLGNCCSQILSYLRSVSSTDFPSEY